MNLIIVWFMIFLVLLPLSVCANTDILPNVACRYEIKVAGKGGKYSVKPNYWYFWRSEKMIQTRDAEGDRGEIWQLTDKDFIAYRKLYHSDKTAIENAPADSALSGNKFNWIQLATMFSQDDLAQLKVTRHKKILGEEAEIRKGNLNGQQVEVAWLMQSQLPAWIKRTIPGETRILELKEKTSFDQSPWQSTSIETIDSYRQIDDTDFGDMENDPFVKKVLHESGHQHAH